MIAFCAKEELDAADLPGDTAREREGRVQDVLAEYRAGGIGESLLLC